MSKGPVHAGDKVKVKRTFDIRQKFWRQKSPVFDRVNRVEHVQLWRQCRPQQPVEFNFVASLYGRATKSKVNKVEFDIANFQFCRPYPIEFVASPYIYALSVSRDQQTPPRHASVKLVYDRKTRRRYAGTECCCRHWQI